MVKRNRVHIPGDKVIMPSEVGGQPITSIMIEYQLPHEEMLTKENLEAAIDAGLTEQQMCERFHCSVWTIHNRKSRWGLIGRPRKRGVESVEIKNIEKRALTEENVIEVIQEGVKSFNDLCKVFSIVKKPRMVDYLTGNRWPQAVHEKICDILGEAGYIRPEEEAVAQVAATVDLMVPTPMASPEPEGYRAPVGLHYEVTKPALTWENVSSTLKATKSFAAMAEQFDMTPDQMVMWMLDNMPRDIDTDSIETDRVTMSLDKDMGGLDLMVWLRQAANTVDQWLGKWEASIVLTRIE